jgi:hypothetical protein
MSEAIDTVEPQHPGHRKDQQNEEIQESRKEQEESPDPVNQNDQGVQNIQGSNEDSEIDLPHHLVETYSGPSVHDMISTHTLAENIIKYGPQILDDDNMALLKRFVMDPDSREQILTDIHIEDVDGVTGQYHGSLAGFIVMRHKTEVGETVEPVLTNDEIETLKEWFRSQEGGSASIRTRSRHSEDHRKGS